VYLGTHCSVCSKRAFTTGVLDRWHNCLLTYWRNVAKRATPTLVCLFLRHVSAKRRRQRSPKFIFRQNLFFPALIVPKPYPSPKLTNEKHILGMSTSPRNDLYFPKQCRLSCSLSQTPLESTHFQLFLGPVKPLRRNSEIFQRLTHAHTDSRFFSKMLIIGVW